MSHIKNNILHKIGVAKNNTPILLILPSNIDYRKELEPFLNGLYETDEINYRDYWESINCLIVNAATIKRNDLSTIFEHINTQSIEANQYKICIIENIEELSPTIANALLKTIEEPQPFTYLIFTTNNIAKVLPTIKSRCNLISLTNPNNSFDINIPLLETKHQKILISSFNNNALLSQWLSNNESKPVIEFIKNIHNNEHDFKLLFPMLTSFLKLDYKQIKIILKYFVHYFPKKTLPEISLILNNYDLNLSKYFIFYALIKLIEEK